MGLKSGGYKSVYVGDLAVYCQSRNMAILEQCLQGCLDKLVTCANKNGFKFSTTKTYIFLAKMAKMGNSFLLKRRSNSLGLFFERKLNFIPHIALRLILRTSVNPEFSAPPQRTWVSHFFFFIWYVCN